MSGVLKSGGVARRRFIRRVGVVPMTKSTSYRGSAQEPLFLVSPYRAHIRSAHARLRPAKEASRLFFLGAATPPNLGGEFHSDASRHSGDLIAPALGSFACTVINVLNRYLRSTPY